jgi:restriction endonuclease Mrr
MNPDTLTNALSVRLLSLPFDAYLQVVARLLEALGYQEVRLAGRADWKGRNRAGGFDLTASLPGGLYPRRVVIQAKQFDGSKRLFQRHADELRGVAIRARASEAMLITTGSISPSLDASALALPILPLRLIGGEQLLALLIKHSIGVTPSGALDEGFFTYLEREARGNRQADCLGSTTLLVEVSLKRVSKHGVTNSRSRVEKQLSLCV